MDVRGIYIRWDPVMDLSARRDHLEELDTSRFPYATIVQKLKFLAGITRPNTRSSVHEVI